VESGVTTGERTQADPLMAGAGMADRALTGRILRIADQAGYRAALIDATDGSVTGRLQTGKGAHNFWPWGDGRHWLLSNRIEGTVSVIDTQNMTIANTIRVAGGPDCMDITPDGKELWVTQRFLRRIAIVDMATLRVVGSIPVGKSPHGVFILKAPAAPTAALPMRAASTEAESK